MSSTAAQAQTAGRKGPAPLDYLTAGKGTPCHADHAAYGLCRRESGHEGLHYDANGYWFAMPDRREDASA